MTIALELSFRNMGHSTFIERTVREHVARLEHLCERATSCHVSVDAPHLRQRKGRHYEVRVELRVPGEALVVSEHTGKRDAHEDMQAVLRDTFDGLERQVLRWKGKRRDGERPSDAANVRAEAFRTEEEDTSGGGTPAVVGRRAAAHER